MQPVQARAATAGALGTGLGRHTTGLGLSVRDPLQPLAPLGVGAPAPFLGPPRASRSRLRDFENCFRPKLRGRPPSWGLGVSGRHQ